jgi:hypothetical protein|tara:strand:- start:11186 stop:11611 length:426 start_codon:yes stop_codon:yes gene_type:complete
MGLRALLAAAAFAYRAYHVLRVGELGSLALVELFQADLVFLLHRPSFARHLSSARHAAHARHPTEPPAHAAHAAEHLREDVVHVRTAGAHAVCGVEGGHAVGVVEVALLVVVEDLVGLFRGLEADFGFGAVVFCHLVGVMC